MTGSVSRRSLLPEGSRLSSSRKRGLRFWRHRGFVLAEALIVLLIVSFSPLLTSDFYDVTPL